MNMHPQELHAWKEADAHLARLLETPAEQWPGMVAALDVSQQVRACLDRLITANQGTGPLDGAVCFSAQAAPEKNLLSGTEIGSWRLDEEIGRGGMAVVYRAHRLGVDFEQVAAVKLLPRGSAGHVHFLREQVVLVQLDHPYIARFLDGGVADDGTPWLAMEMVEGERLDRAVHSLDAHRIVAIMLDIIDAVAFAHRHLVIHRDLKPGNVLVDRYGRPRLLDFGIAKLLTEKTPTAATRLLTPEYAAPEQFSGEPVSTATDVYGLGAILHTLLIGEPPRDRAGKRRLDLVRKIPDADLRSIIEKALRDDPADRYGTAQALGADLQRWRSNQPVEARPDSRRYRFRKWLVRHRNASLTGAAVILLIVTSVFAVLWQANRASQQARTVAAQNAVLIELLASPQRGARGRRVEVAEILEDAPALIEANLPEPSADRAELLANLAQTLDQLGRAEPAVELWEKAIADLDATAPRERRQPVAYRLGLARALSGMADYPRAMALLESLANRARSDLPAEDELHALIAIQKYSAQRLKGTVPAADALQAALDAGAAVEWQTDAARGEYQCGRLQALVDSGRFPEAADLAINLRDWAKQTFGNQHNATLCAFESGVAAMSRAGRLNDAEAFAREGAAVAAEWLGENDRLVFSLRNSRANVLEELGRFDEAIALHREQIAHRDQVSGLTAHDRITPVQGLAVAYLESGRYEEAEPVQLEVVAYTKESLGPDAPPSLMALANLAELRVFAGNAEAAREPAEMAHTGLSSALGPDHPVTVFARSIMGGVQVQLGNGAEALKLLETTPAELAAAFGENDINVVNAKTWLAAALIQVGRIGEAETLAVESLQWRERHLGANHPRTLAVRSLLTQLGAGGGATSQ